MIQVSNALSRMNVVLLLLLILSKVYSIKRAAIIAILFDAKPCKRAATTTTDLVKSLLL